LLLAGVFTAGIVWSSLENVEQRRSYQSAVGQAARLSAKNAQLAEQNEALKVQIAEFERQLQVNQVAYKKLTGQLSESANYINELREDLDFYQSIISPQDNKAGVSIQALSIEKLTNGGYRYRVTLVQALKHDNAVAGSVVIKLAGSQAGEAVTVNLNDLGDPPGKLSFRYFQVLEGEFVLPSGFTPRNVEILAITNDKGKTKKSEIAKSYTWPTFE
jgi:hypothetical protein